MSFSLFHLFSFAPRIKKRSSRYIYSLILNLNLNLEGRYRNPLAAASIYRYSIYGTEFGVQKSETETRKRTVHGLLKRHATVKYRRTLLPQKLVPNRVSQPKVTKLFHETHGNRVHVSLGQRHEVQTIHPKSLPYFRPELPHARITNFKYLKASIQWE